MSENVLNEDNSSVYKDNALSEAVLSLSTDDVCEALAAGGDPNHTILGKYRGTRTLLHAVCKGYEPGGYDVRAFIVERLLEAGAKPNTLDSEGEVPLHVALHYVADPTIRALVKHGADLHSKQQGLWAYPVLTVAAQGGLDWLVAQCLTAGADVQHLDGGGGSPLHGAYYQIPVIGGRFNLSVAKRLIEAGADVNAVNREEAAPIHLAARWVDSVPGLALLLESGADITLADKKGNRPIHLAAEFSSEGKLALLLKHGADLDVQNRKGFTPLLHQIAENGFSEQTARLIALGADVKAVGKKGETVFSLWISKNNRFKELEYIERTVLADLLKRGAPAAPMNSSLTGLLHRLAKGEHDDLIPAAVSAGASLSTTAKDGWTPLHNAAVHCDSDTVAALLAAGADASVVSSKVRKIKGKAFAMGCTAKDVAEMLGNTKTAALL